MCRAKDPLNEEELGGKVKYQKSQTVSNAFKLKKTLSSTHLTFQISCPTNRRKANKTETSMLQVSAERKSQFLFYNPY